MKTILFIILSFFIMFPLYGKIKERVIKLKSGPTIIYVMDTTINKCYYNLLTSRGVTSLEIPCTSVGIYFRVYPNNRRKEKE